MTHKERMELVDKVFKGISGCIFDLTMAGIIIFCFVMAARVAQSMI